jgi:hypothetical protein
MLEGSGLVAGSSLLVTCSIVRRPRRLTDGDGGWLGFWNDRVAAAGACRCTLQLGLSYLGLSLFLSLSLYLGLSLLLLPSLLFFLPLLDQKNLKAANGADPITCTIINAVCHDAGIVKVS